MAWLGLRWICFVFPGMQVEKRWHAYHRLTSIRFFLGLDGSGELFNVRKFLVPALTGLPFAS